MSLILATEILHKGLWYPTILGVLVVVAAVVLFLGSIYVLLGTNVGARLGFLIAFTGLAGFMVVLTLLWMHHRVAPQHAQGPHPAVEGAGGHRVAREVEDLRRPRHQAEVRTSPRPPKRPT